LGRFWRVSDPVVEQASSDYVRNTASHELDPHNMYAELLSEAGFPGLLLFVAFLFVVMQGGLAHRARAPVLAAVVSFGVLMFLILFIGDVLLSGVFLLPIALLLGVTAEDDGSASRSPRGEASDRASPLRARTSTRVASHPGLHRMENDWYERPV
jgi:O-antigen ligase